MSEEITPLDKENPMVPGGSLDNETFEALKEALADMESQVVADVFVTDNCHYCEETIKLLNYFVEASPKKNGYNLFTYRVHRKGVDDDFFKSQGVTRTPTVTLLDGKIKYTGIPSGEEIRSLVETIIRISQGESGLEEESKNLLKQIENEVYVEVIVTPMCPYCPYAVLLSNMIAFESYLNGKKNVVSDTVEAYENPDIADKYNVMSVPAIAINGESAFIGLPYELDFVKRVYLYSRRER